MTAAMVPTRWSGCAADAEAIVGVTALEPVGIGVGPQTQRLKRLPAVRLE